jgi:putative glutamine amidotransferase
VSAPAIGICAAVERVSWGVWNGYEVTLAPRSYVRAVQAAGGIGLILPPDQAAVADPDILLDRVDALILAGGADIDPASYGAEPHPETKGSWPDRDAFEIALARRAIERDLPLLGICRGMQLINVALGGSLDQHLPESTGSQIHRAVGGTFGEHEVRLQPGTLACAAAGREGFAVMSHHHQGLDRVGEGLRVSGWSVGDELAEAIELPGKRFALGVVWHPEEDPESKVIGALVEAARAVVA